MPWFHLLSSILPVCGLSSSFHNMNWLYSLIVNVYVFSWERTNSLLILFNILKWHCAETHPTHTSPEYRNEKNYLKTWIYYHPETVHCVFGKAFEFSERKMFSALWLGECIYTYHLTSGAQLRLFNKFMFGWGEF